jgi:uncharacterized peroxidase-related enzyme
MFLKTVAEADAADRVAEIYAKERADLGLVMTATTCLTVRPGVLPVVSDFFAGVKNGFTLSMRDWRLITFVAAIELPSTYCTTVYGRNLIADLGSKEMVLAVRRDFRNAGLSERDVAMLAYAQKIVRSAHEITHSDIDGLRALDFTDAQIADIALCTAIRCFIASYFEATGAGPEAKFIDDDDAFRKAMTVGRALPT